MCGLYGFIGNPTNESKYIINVLGINNERRGRDSSGMAYFDGERFRITKRVEPAHRFLKHKPAQRGMQSSIVIGHTRLATHGDVNWENAHPFQFEDWIFAHNGVISNFHELNQMLGKDYKVDSQVIGDLLPNRINLLRGSYAIVAINKKEPDKIYFWRWFSPLFVAMSQGGSFFSSIGPILQDLLPEYNLREAPNGSYGVIEKGRMSFDFLDLPHYDSLSMPILFSRFRLMGSESGGANHATFNLDAQALGLQGRSRSCSFRGLEQGLVC